MGHQVSEDTFALLRRWSSLGKIESVLRDGARNFVAKCKGVTVKGGRRSGRVTRLYWNLGGQNMTNFSKGIPV